MKGLYALTTLVAILNCVSGDVILTAPVGALSYTVTSQLDSGIWRIAVPSVPLQRVHFCFDDLNIDSAELQVYDLADYQQGRQAVFDCISCGRDIPPMFSSRTGNVIIFIKGVIGVNFRSSFFSFTYIAEPVSYDKVGQTFDNIALTYKMGYGKIFPMTVEDLMPPSTLTTWNLNIAASQITFSFDLFPVEAAASCSASLAIYDGATDAAPVIFSGAVADGLPSEWLYSSSGRVLVKLQNGPSVSACNFEISYYADVSLYHCGSLFVPDIVKSSSMIISDGSVIAANMRRSESCYWRMLAGEEKPLFGRYYSSTTSSSGVADATARLTLLFPWVQLKNGGQVIVFDSDENKGNILWNSIGTNTVVPPPLRSTGTSMYIAYTSNSQLSTGFRGFRGEFLTQSLGSAGVGSQKEIYAMSSALDITPPGYTCYGSDCMYTSGLTYSFLITPQSIAEDSVISFVFSSLDIRDVDDSLTIYDGSETSAPVLARWEGGSSGQPLPYQWINSTGHSALVVFVSAPDPSNSGVFKFGGFKFSYYSDGPNYHCGFSTNPATLVSPSYLFSDGSAASQTVIDSEKCRWVVDPVGSPGGVTLLFHRMDLDSESYLVIYAEDSAGSRVKYTTITNTGAVPVPIIVKEKMYIDYSTSEDPSGKGFLVSYFSAQGANTRSGGDAGSIFLFCTSMMKLELPPSSLTLGSSLYEPGWSATWEIRPTTSNGPMFLSLNKLDFPDDCSDYLALYANFEGSTELAWTSCPRITGIPLGVDSRAVTSHDAPWVSLSNADATLKFYSSAESKGNSSFDISYITDGTNFHCGFAQNPAFLNAPSFVFTDGSDSFESMYQNQDCEWVVQPKASNISSIDLSLAEERIVLFLSVHFSDLVGARLRIYDGDSMAGGVLLWDCDGCTHSPPQLSSEYGSFFVKFTSSDSSQMGMGFRLYYYSAVIPASQWSSSTRTSEPRACTRPAFGSYPAVASCDQTAQVLLEHPFGFQMDGSVRAVPDLDVSGQAWMLDYPERVMLQREFNDRGQLMPAAYTRPVGVLSFWPSSSFESTAASPVGEGRNFIDYVRSGRSGNALAQHSPLFTAGEREGDVKDRYYCGTWHTETPEEDLASIAGYYDGGKYSRAIRNSSFDAHSPILRDRLNGFEFRPSQVGGQSAVYVAPPNIWVSGQANMATSPDQLYTFTNDDESGSTTAFESAASGVKYDIPYPASTCKYAINTAPGVPIVAADNGKDSGGFPVTFRILKTTCTGASSKRLRIFGGIYGNDTLLFDSSGVEGVPSGASTVVAACGRAVVLLDNINGAVGDVGESNASETCGFEIDYSVDYTDDKSRACNKYIRSIYYVPPEPVDYLAYLIPIVGVVIALLCLCCSVVYLPPLILLLQEKYKAYDRLGLSGMRRNVKTTSLHPRYTPKLDQWRNKFLYKGTCCVCKDGPYHVFKLSCGHQMCTDDLRGYVETALGDVSMFPVKCPMHYEGCEGTVGSDVAKRVVTKAQYDRFIDFLDRSLFGDGIRCIFCENFVIYPSNSKVSMVTCPYCVQIFCMRCRQPWHYGAVKCPLEKAEDECLETWKATSGAQRCPACRKLIEKDDPDTCHHMVHRSSDGIPCLRDRTDFCYLCGMEVAAEYPHDEINNDNQGINHFPDGVFQKCRTIINREKAEERERLRKSKRRKSPTKKPGYASNFVLPTEWDSETASTPGGHSNDVELVGGPAFSVANALSEDAALAAALAREEDRTRFEADFDAPWEEAVRLHPASPVRTVRRNPRGGNRRR